MAKKSIHLRVDPGFHKLVNDSGLSSRIYTKLLAEELWDNKINHKKSNGRRGGLGGFIV